MDCLWEEEPPDLLTEEEEICSDHFDPLYLEEIQETIKRISVKHTGPLINVDYNLNSPLLSERPDAVLNTLRGRSVEQRLSSVPGVKSASEVFKHLGLNWDRVEASEGFHSWVASTVFEGSLKSNQFSNRLGSLLEKSKDAVEVLETFWTHLTENKDPLPIDPMKMDWVKGNANHPSQPRLLQDGEWFWLFHRIVMMMNSSTKEERSSLVRSELDHLKWIVKEEKEGFIASSNTPEYGIIHVVPGYVFFQLHNRLLNRDMTLMVKDTLIARYASKMSLLCRSDGQDGPDALKKLTAFYAEGDSLMSSLGNSVYDILKLVEPHCNFQMSIIAHQNRPLIPLDTSFRYHLSSSLETIKDEMSVDPDPLFRMIKEEYSHRQVLLYYGAFRHWGHPFLDYEEGLRRLHAQVQLEKTIDTEYAEALASDLAYMVLEKEFFTQRQWFVDLEKLDVQDPLYNHVQNTTWPTPLEIRNYGDRWHLLPLIPCYTVPQTIDPSVLYGDRSHSMNRSEVIRHVQAHPDREIPSRKVLRTALETPQTNVKDFLQDVNDKGLRRDDLVIGLKGKEREIKREGRFFSLMSWNLRQYFVTTEHLIKEFYVPLFSGLTMADDLTKVTKKLLDNSIHQGRHDYASISVANHVDYEKWNNHQRGPANDPVFRVMGQFLGLPEVFVRTHQFFQESLVYYGPRPDMMKVSGDSLISTGTFPACWEGQLGGLEGLRQKGWSIVNLLVLLREAKTRNTLVKTLAQGDNQVICNSYKLPTSETEEELKSRIQEVMANNTAIMTAVSTGTGKLGLIINQDETMYSSDFLSYGKVPVYRGNILPLEAKRWSRVTCVTNDQLPSLSNVMSTIATNAITISQHSLSLLDPTIDYVFFGFMAICITEYHDTLLQRGIEVDLAKGTEHQRRTFYLRSLFLDPSVGGASGTSLTRFLIRQFPDPVTESLTFWRILYNGTSNRYIQSVALEAGHPKLGAVNKDNWTKLLERPTSLNIPKGLSAITLLKSEIRKSLEENIEKIQNETFSSAIKYLSEHENQLVSFLQTIKPLFPRFVSEFKGGTFLGLTESLISLFQNARTIRNNFSYKFAKKIAVLLRLSEEISVGALMGPHLHMPGREMWTCSSSQADLLRTKSWGSAVVGTTVPHPAEYLGVVTEGTSACHGCSAVGQLMDYITVCYPRGFSEDVEQRGPLPAYLGSRTTESTDLFHPWEKESTVPLVDRAAKLRTAINWFVDPDDGVAKSILNNLSALTGEDWQEEITNFSRTGSALHRFFCTRQSNGGFVSMSPTPLTHLIVTADTMRQLSGGNYDFMYQSSLIYSETVSVERNRRAKSPSFSHHFHVGCSGCIRPIFDINLSSPYTYHPPDRSSVIRAMCGSPSFWNRSRSGIPLREGNWDAVTPNPKSFHIGVAQGLMFGLLTVDRNPDANEGSLFPNIVGPNLLPGPYLAGILQGLYLSASYNVAYHRSSQQLKRPKELLQGSALKLIHHLSRHPGFSTMVSQPTLLDELKSVAHRVPSSYPPSKSDISHLIETYFIHHVVSRTLTYPRYKSMSETLWIFADSKTPRLAGLSVISHRLYQMFQEPRIEGKLRVELNELKELISYYCSRKLLSPMEESSLPEPEIKRVAELCRNVVWCKHEVRHAARAGMVPLEVGRRPRSRQNVSQKWGQEYVGQCVTTSIDFSNTPTVIPESVLIPRIRDPLINGLRMGQLATGAHYKLRCLLRSSPAPRAFICGGDGSGGMTAALLRMYPHSLGIFNSLMTLEGRNMRGVIPGPPSAIACLDPSIRLRCLNWRSCWDESSDLRETRTWDNFIWLKDYYRLDIDLIVFDFEFSDLESTEKIEQLITLYVPQLLMPSGKLIYKTFGTVIKARQGKGVSDIGSMFQRVELAWTELSGSFTSELYLICIGPLQRKLEGRFANSNSLCHALRTCCANRSLSEELERACRLNPRRLLAGITPELVPSFLTEMTNVLITLGLSHGYADEVAGILRVHTNQSLMIRPVCLAVMSLFSNSILDVTPEQQASGYAPPSDQKLQRHLGFFLGTWLYLAWSAGKLNWYQRIHHFLRGPISYLYGTSKTHYTSSTRHSLKWDWDFGPHRTKTLQRPESLALVAQVIRIWASTFPDRENKSGNWEFLVAQVDGLLSRFNRHLTVSVLLSNTGLFYPMFGPKPGLWKDKNVIVNTMQSQLDRDVLVQSDSSDEESDSDDNETIGGWVE
nr:MAG: RNA-dependent RNA polymerase [Rhabdoviridae sp.]